MFIQNRPVWSQIIFTTALLIVGVANLAYGASPDAYKDENQATTSLVNTGPPLTLVEAINLALADNPNLAEGLFSLSGSGECKPSAN